MVGVIGLRSRRWKTLSYDASKFALVSLSEEFAAVHIDKCRTGCATDYQCLQVQRCGGDFDVACQSSSRIPWTFPGLTANILEPVDRLLPSPGGNGTRHVKGKNSTSALSRSFLAALTEWAGRRNNEIPPEEQNEVAAATSARA